MSRLYPPQIEGTIPAFDGTTLVVPFSLNKAVSANEVTGVNVKIKTVNGVLKDTLRAALIKLDGDCEATFTLNKNNYTVGQFYKVQIAFVSGDKTKGEKEDVGYYSTVAVVKCTTEPVVSIEGLEFQSINPHNYYYTGVYSQQGKDSTEKMYSYRFIISDGSGNIIDDTGEKIHNSSKDVVSYEAYEEYCFAKDIKSDESYFIKFIVTTTNGMIKSSPKYRISQKRSIKPEIDIELVATLDEGSGFIDLTIGRSSAELITGTFLLSRNSSNDDESWVEFKRFNLHAVQASTFSIKDCTVEHGTKYKYSIQQYNKNKIYSERIISNTVMVDFEDMFLYDGNRQLRIRYNPQISSFKTDYADQKTDTIGSQHPFILRNGNMAYKEFPISGLISYHMDEDNNMFMSKKKLGIDTPMVDLTSENIIAERIFKMEVLDWLNDGKPKLFRSPAEGNFIVRLMNVSMSPEKALGRMLHNFSATAYEIAPFNAQSLEKFKIIDAAESLEEQMQWSSVYLQDLFDEYNPKDEAGNFIQVAPVRVQLNTTQRRAYSVRFTDLMPGTIVYIEDEEIMIGATGAFLAESEKGFTYIGINSRFLTQGMVTYGYKAKTVTMFNLVDNLTLKDVPVKQFIGNSDLTGFKSLHNALEDLRTEVTSISMVRFSKRPVQYLYIDYDGVSPILQVITNRDTIFYLDMDCKHPLEDFTTCDELTTYQLRLRRTNKKYTNVLGEQYYVDKNTEMFAPYLDYYLDGKFLKRNQIICKPISQDMYDIQIDDEILNIEEIEKYSLSDPETFKMIMPGNGVITEIGYSSQIITYSFESTDYNLRDAKNKYEMDLKGYWREVSSGQATDSSLLIAKTTMNNSYMNYLHILQGAVNDYKEAYGVL